MVFHLGFFCRNNNHSLLCRHRNMGMRICTTKTAVAFRVPSVPFLSFHYAKNIKNILKYNTILLFHSYVCFDFSLDLYYGAIIVVRLIYNVRRSTTQYWPLQSIKLTVKKFNIIQIIIFFFLTIVYLTGIFLNLNLRCLRYLKTCPYGYRRT